MDSTPSHSTSRKLPFFLWWLASWLALAGLIYGLIQKPAEQSLLILGSVAMALPFALRAIHASRNVARFFRVLFWFGELLGMLLIALVLDETRLNLPLFLVSNQFLGAGIGLMVLGCVWALIRIARIKPASNQGVGRLWWPVDCGFAVLWLILIPALAYLFMDYIYIPRVARASQMKWAEIGRPMPEFEKQCTKIEENDSLRELLHDLEPFGVKSFYRAKHGEKSPNNLILPQEVVVAFGHLGERKGDRPEIHPTPATKNSSPLQADELEKVTRFFSTHEKELNRLYEGVLRREPPVWEFDPGYELDRKEPDFLIARQLTQMISVDACLKLQRGDTKGAATACAAADRMFKNLNENPSLISFMIRVAIDALLDASVSVRLPEEPETMKALAAEVDSKHEQLQRRLQLEARYCFRAATNPAITWSVYQNNDPHFGSRFSEKILRPAIRVFYQLDAAKAAGILAPQYQICSRWRELIHTDLGVDEIDRINHAYPTVFVPNLLRAVLRTNFCLLLREETAVLRAARTQMAAGTLGAQGEWPSALVPGSKWVVTGDASDNSVKLKLTPMPKWVTGREVVDDAFFPVLPDGSSSWKLITSPNTAQGEKAAL